MNIRKGIFIMICFMFSWQHIFCQDIYKEDSSKYKNENSSDIYHKSEFKKIKYELYELKATIEGKNKEIDGVNTRIDDLINRVDNLIIIFLTILGEGLFGNYFISHGAAKRTAKEELKDAKEEIDEEIKQIKGMKIEAEKEMQAVKNYVNMVEEMMEDVNKGNDKSNGVKGGG